MISAESYHHFGDSLRGRPTRLQLSFNSSPNGKSGPNVRCPKRASTDNLQNVETTNATPKSVKTCPNTVGRTFKSVSTTPKPAYTSPNNVRTSPRSTRSSLKKTNTSTPKNVSKTANKTPKVTNKTPKTVNKTPTNKNKNFDTQVKRKVSFEKTSVGLISVSKSDFEETAEPNCRPAVKATHSKLKEMMKEFASKTEGLQEAFTRCSMIAHHLRDCNESRKLVVEECQLFDIEFKDLVVPNDEDWTTDIYCVISVLGLKAAIFFAGERDTKFEDKYPIVEHIQLLENVAPILEKILDLCGKLSSTDMPTSQKIIPGLCKLAEDLNLLSAVDNATQLHAKVLAKELEIKFPSCGAELLDLCYANYLDPRFKGQQLKNLGKLDETKLNISSELIFSINNNKLTGQNKTNIEKEVEIYESSPLASKTTNVQSWWEEKRSVLPTLALIAKQYCF